MARKMKEKFNKYWSESHILFTIACILDPRMKIFCLKYNYPKIYVHEIDEKMKTITEVLHELFAFYFNILDWWKMSAIKFKILSKMAKDIFTIPITTIASESAFSTGGRVLGDYRSVISPKTLDALVCTESWIRAAHKNSKDLIVSLASSLKIISFNFFVITLIYSLFIYNMIY
ncbi:Putative AC transposase [Apostasia shenzhenica]|uniref:AC transposase n=1 Tax=Apostasia shenzhenica TaxID=1088818 RepID=A0A2I0AQE9_9ASPA|nr:Putative AC transposase [Apostasia shenzhenica]